MKRSELLAPAGSYETLLGVIKAGADAIYIAGREFGARAYAQNFDTPQLLRALDYAHIHDKKIYLTVNTLLKSDEIASRLYDYLLPFYESGLDGILIQDLGVFSFVKKYFPDLDIHISTQMTANSSYSVNYFQKLGAKRVVLSRELSIDDIATISQKTDIEIEAFVHGALCYCYSGKCLYSSLIGQRSGNRGRCAQPCRLPYSFNGYNNKYLLSLKDLCGIDLLIDMLNANVYSFKIEGRMKQGDYAANVVSLYRKYLDMAMEDPDNYHVSDKDRRMLFELGNRSGFTSGYLTNSIGKDMISVKSPSLQRSIKDSDIRFTEDKLPIDISVTLKNHKEAYMTVSIDAKGIKHTVYGDLVTKANNRPLTKSDVESKILALGDSLFSCNNFDIEMDEDIFYPAKALKTLRRTAISELCSLILNNNFKKATIQNDNINCKSRELTPIIKPCLSVLVSNIKQLKICENVSFIDRMYLSPCLWYEAYNSADNDVFDIINNTEKLIYYVLPDIIDEKTAEKLKNVILSYDNLPLSRFMATSYDGLGLLDELGIIRTNIFLDNGIYAFNDNSQKTIKDMGYEGFTYSYENNYQEIRAFDFKGEMIIYGNIPLMQTKGCIKRNYKSCNKKSEYISFKDRKDESILSYSNCDFCYNTIYNFLPLFLMHQSFEIKKLNCTGYRIVFTNEDYEQIDSILNAYKDAFVLGQKINPDKYIDKFTKGHFKRGVE